MSMPSSSTNIYLTLPLGRLFTRTALPIVAVMLTNGLFTLVDAYVLGIFAGAQALTAVTLVFPLTIALVALSSLVSSGFSSIYARALGADDHRQAGEVYHGALQLGWLCALIVNLLVWTAGHAVALRLADGDPALGGLGWRYLAILAGFAPVAFSLSVNTDALRAEGRMGLMTSAMVLSTALNIGFDLLFVAGFGWGVAGSALGTVLAQALSLALILSRRGHLGTRMRLQSAEWSRILALGAPMSLGYVGLSLSSAVTLSCLQAWAPDSYPVTAAAFGLITRLMTFLFLPLLGLSFAAQSIIGNNHGAGLGRRSILALVTGACVALAYCSLAQTGFFLFRNQIGAIFVADQGIVAEVSRILPVVTITLFLFGPQMMIAAYFQAIGDAARAGLLGLSRTFLFGIPLTVILPFWKGEPGIWWSGPLAELLVLVLTIAAVASYRRNRPVPA